MAIAKAALPAVVALLQDTRRPAGQSLAAMCLCFASRNPQARAFIAQAVLPSLAAMLSAGDISGLPVFMMQVSEAALTVLSALTMDVDDHRGAVVEAALPALVSIIQQAKRPGSDSRHKAACVLQHLAASGHLWVQQRVADAALPGLVELMRSNDDRRERLMAVEAVSVLAASGARLQPQVHGMVHAEIMLQAQQKTDIKSRRAARQALSQLEPSKRHPGCCTVMWQGLAVCLLRCFACSMQCLILTSRPSFTGAGTR